MLNSGNSERLLLNASWLIKLRWVAVFGQLLTIGGAIALFQLKLPLLWPLWTVIALTAISNGIFQLIFGRMSRLPLEQQPPWNLLLGLLMVMDILSLTSLLFASGGPTNPFCLFFFVNLSLSALLLSRVWAWALNMLTIGCFSLLLFSYHPIAELDMGLAMLPFEQRTSGFPDAVWGRFSLVQLGYLAAFGTCSSVIVYFMTRLTDEVRQQEADLRQAQERQSRTQKLEALGTLAAGAAHELATPLSTIAVVAGDAEAMLSRADSQGLAENQELVEDIRLIRSELNRCRGILDTMAADAGQAVGERVRKIQLGSFWTQLAEGYPQQERIEFISDPETVACWLEIPVIGLTHALRALVKNALDAGPTDSPVQIVVRQVGEHLEWLVRDRGPGMSREVLDRIREPFFTTKQPGQGMGLGVFLAQNILERVGGRLEYDSRPGEGTTVRVEIPLAPLPSAWSPMMPTDRDQSSPFRILIVDDDDILRVRLERSFNSRGYIARATTCMTEALAELPGFRPDFAVVDLKMPGQGGLELLAELQQRSPQTKTVVLTGYGSIANAVEAVKLGAIDYLTKPADADQILTAFNCGEEIPRNEFQTASLASAQWEHIQRVLADCNGNITEAARRLDIPRRTLQRKLKKMAP